MQDLKSTAESILNGPIEGMTGETYVAGMSLLIDEVTAVESTAEKKVLTLGKLRTETGQWENTIINLALTEPGTIRRK